MARNKALTELAAAISKIRSQTELTSFLGEILTDKELNEISRRMEIIRLLESGSTQREIAKRLGVGIATVSRGARELQRRSTKE